MTVELDPRYRFENYIVGSANRLAVSAAKAVAQAPGTAYNPLFIYSSSGLGKTHLMIAVGHLAMQLQPQLRSLYITLDEFVEELTAAVSAGTIESYKQRFQTIDLLLLDDVQFLAGRRETQSEMLRLFNALQRAGKQIILTSDRPPNEIADLDERLITRFAGGLVVDVGLPDYETRVAILRAKCEERGATFENGVLDEVARMSYSNVRELQGALNRLIACQTLGEAEVTVRNVRELLGEKPDAAPAVAGGSRGQEFASFLSDLSDVVAQHIDTSRVRIVEAMTYWHQLGYETTLLERTLEHTEDLDVDALLTGFEASIARLRALEQEAARYDPGLVESELFHDPERVGEAELLVARLGAAAHRRSAAHARDVRGRPVEPARRARGGHRRARAGTEVQPALHPRPARRRRLASPQRARQRDGRFGGRREDHLLRERAAVHRRAHLRAAGRDHRALARALPVGGRAPHR